MFGLSQRSMPGATIDEILDSYKDADGQAYLAGPPGFGEYLSTQVSGTFKDYTTPGRALEEYDIQQREKAASHYDPVYYHWDPLAGGERPKNKYAIDEKTWRESEWYREGVEYTDAMTPERAQALAENYDERRFREALVAAGDQAYGALGRIAGFGAMMIGGLPDPINLIPFSGGMKAAKVAATEAISAGKSAWVAGIKAGAKAGTVEGALGGAVSSALTLPDLKAKGEDIGFADFLMTVGVSAGIGSVIGGIGGGISAYRGVKADKALQAEIAAYLDSEEAKSTADLRLRLQQEMFQAYGGSAPDVDRKLAEQWAIADAAMFDKRAHTWARVDKNGTKTAVDYYTDPRNYPEWLGVFVLEEQIRREFGTPDSDFLGI
ncbi:MAG: hypothetical protein IJU79_00040 [Desulfovibrionaceae bacterium]|nr:hypothetical protein [Desulfovibrionaceae bacterium]